MLLTDKSISSGFQVICLLQRLRSGYSKKEFNFAISAMGEGTQKLWNMWLEAKKNEAAEWKRIRKMSGSIRIVKDGIN